MNSFWIAIRTKSSKVNEGTFLSHDLVFLYMGREVVMAPIYPWSDKPFHLPLLRPFSPYSASGHAGSVVVSWGSYGDLGGDWDRIRIPKSIDRLKVEINKPGWDGFWGRWGGAPGRLGSGLWSGPLLETQSTPVRQSTLNDRIVFSSHPTPLLSPSLFYIYNQ